MERRLKEILVDKSSLSWIINADGLYVDKTSYLLKLVRSGSYFFLSRPRRFGKSLTIDTLENIFKGNKELFKGLYIYDRYDFEEYPVIRFSMIAVNSRDIALMRKQLMKQVEKIGRAFEVLESMDLSVATPSDYLESLRDAVSAKYKKQVVILIDEYDYPLMENIQSGCFEQVKEEMSNFYNILKAEEENIRFCFLTGVTRFQHVSIFSKLNNLIDISSSPEYAALCGYTDQEIDHYFAPYIENYYEKNSITEEEDKEAFRKSIKDYYDGYRFSMGSDVTLYNPVSIGKFFNGNCIFRNFWISTGSQTIVNEIIRRHPEFFSSERKMEIGINSLSSVEIKNLQEWDVSAFDVYSYLVQTGYLTINGISGGRYVLNYPNLEVKDTMETALLSTSYGLDIYSDDIVELRNYFKM